MDKRYFSDKVVEWYEHNKRELPWRDTKDPYRIWLSEIILQQTRVNQGLPYYLQFVEIFPDVGALASAPEQDVLRLWQGLGYYSRARNLHKCAQEVVANHRSLFPSTFESLKKLPGIGDYTAAAIASFSFKETVAVVDGNVFRVLARIFGIEDVINSPAGKKRFTILANELISRERPDLHNQAVMEFGALHCTPKNPACPTCPFTMSCVASENKIQHLLPVKLKSKAPRKRYFYYFVIRKGKSLWMKKREKKDIWHGLFDFFLIEKNQPTAIKKIIDEWNDKNRTDFKAGDIDISVPYKHVLSHQVIITKFILIETRQLGRSFAMEPLQNYSVKKISELPKPVLISRFLSDYQLL